MLTKATIFHKKDSRCQARGCRWFHADALVADKADVLAADDADVLAVSTTDVLSADNIEAAVPGAEMRSIQVS